MRLGLALAGALLATLTACGSSDDDKIVMTDPSADPTSLTYRQLEKEIEESDVLKDPIDCDQMLRVFEAEGNPKFPEGRELPLKACNEARKARLRK
jgi:hypothetical protein